MKKQVILITVLCGCCGLLNCGDDEPLTEDRLSLSDEQLAQNYAVLDSAFSLTIKKLSGTNKVKKLVEGSGSEEEFMMEMNRMTMDVFDEAIEIALKIKDEPYKNSKQSAARLSDFNLNSLDNDPLRSFAAAIQHDADKDHKGEIELLSISWPGVVEALEGFELIMTNDDAQVVDDAIDDLLAKSKEPIFVALLLPAVQKCREAARSVTKGQVMMESVFSDVIISSVMREEFFRQQKAAGYLGGLDLLVSGEYKKDNEAFVSMETTRAIYLNTTAQLWHQAWKVYQ
jgi:hypothetical protein